MKNDKLLIVEDDPFISASIKNVLQEKGFEIVGIAKTVKNALQLLHSEKPDLCLIDIQLKSMENGTVFAKELDKLQLPYFYLTAQTDPLTLSEVSETNPLGYIVKPFTQSGLWSTISVTWQQYQKEKDKILTIKVDGYIHRIKETDILFLEAFDNYCYINTLDKRLLAPHTLKKIREQLKGKHYFMPHRSFWVNIYKITNVGKRSIIINNLELTLSEARRGKLLTLMKHL
jgi:DNA-binding LytR/AlgR family response regulator